MRRSCLAAAATAAAVLTFAPGAAAQVRDRCPPGERCRTVSVPLDRTGRIPGTIPVFYRVQPATGPRTGVVVLLEHESDRVGLHDVAPLQRLIRALRASNDVVRLDYRGTRRSGPLTPCDGAPGCAPAPPRCDVPSRHADVTACARVLGELRSVLSTTETARDVEAVRIALAAERLTLIGASYGARVAGTYARLHPDRTAALVLDSPVPIEGADALVPLRRSSLRRVLRAVCRSEACGASVRDAGAALDRLARRLPLRGKVFDGDGRTVTRRLVASQLHRLLAASDTDERLRPDLPGAIASGARGDAAPLLHILTHERPGTEPPEPGEGDLQPNTARTLATTCTEGRLPWAPEGPLAGRAAAARAELADRRATFAPFDPAVVFAASPARRCLVWPPTPRPEAVPSAGPAVPVLVVVGREDLRTPREDARAVAAQYPDARLLTVPLAGHLVLHTDTRGCAARAVSRFLRGRPAERCAGGRRLWRVLPPIPATARGLRPSGGATGSGGRTATAVELTVQAASHEVARFYRPPRNLGYVDQPGLRGGFVRFSRDAVALDRAEWITGVRVSGTLRRRSVRLTVEGPAGGRLTGTPRRLRGTLGGQAVDLRLPDLREGERLRHGIAGPRAPTPGRGRARR